jgi:iduronate 2-sulfatase
MHNIKRRDFMGLAGASLLGLCCRGLAQEATKARNVLFVAVDDLRPELGCYGHPVIKSPNLDRLAADGLLFNRAYCQQAVCAPSRISLLTGMRPDSTTVHDLKHPLRRTIPKALSMPQHFLTHGYETVSLGKIYHHGNDDNDIGWTTPAWHPSGDWKGRGYLDPESQANINLKNKTQRGVGPAFESPDVPDSAYSDGMIADKAIEELRRLKGGAKPFFLAVGFLKPHLPFNAPKRYWDLYDREKIQLSPQKEWPKGMPALASNGNGTSWEIGGYTNIPKNTRPYSDDLSKALIHGYYACVSYMDAQVGRLLNELESLGLRDDTIVILWGDHGWKLSEYSAWCKHTNFEIDTHAPLLLSVPGSKRGQKTDALVEFVDIFPTLCDLTGLEIPESCEGASMVPLLQDPDQQWKAAAFSQYPRGKVMGYSMRSGNWRYTEWIDGKSGEVTERELYDHSAGPVATANLAGDPKHADTVKELSALLASGKGWQKLQRQGRLVGGAG